MKPILFYLLQVIAASGLLYGYYHFALRNKKFHRYNRFYLLMAVVISASIPFFNIPVYFSQKEAESSVVLQTLQVISSPSFTNESPAVSSTVQTESITATWFTAENVIYLFYLFILSFFLLRFFISLNKIKSLIKRNPVEQLDKIKFINTDEPGTPFSFFRWLFWNRKIELHSEKGEQIFRHELFHIQQKHSWDTIFMELVSTIFWINPFFHLMKKELKAIHEFLADEFAIKENNNWQYAELLLMQVLNTNNQLVNPFFHNQIKRRIAMITTSQKPSYRYIRKLMVLPVAAIILFLFAFKYKNRQTDHREFEKAINSITVVIDAGHGGTDKGAKTKDGKYNEAELSLLIAKKIEALGPEYNINVIMTRTDEKFPDGAINKNDALKKRVELVNNLKPHAFIAIHMNTTSETGQISKSGFDAYVTNQRYNQPDLQLASSVLGELKKIYTTREEIKQRGDASIYVIDEAKAPSLLLECGFINNPKDISFVTNEKNQEKIARAILQGLVAFANSGNVKVKGNITVKAYTGSDTTRPGSNAKNDLKNALVVIDGVIQPERGFYSIDSNLFLQSKIEELRLFTNKTAIEKYGEKGKDGVIEIDTKGNYKKAADTIPKVDTIYWIKDLPPPAKKSPTAAQLKTWEDAKMYGVWIGSKRINNSELAKYKPSDFVFYYVSKLTKTAINYGKHYYQINLYTKEDYDRSYGPDKPRTSVLVREVVSDSALKLNEPLLVINDKPMPGLRMSTLNKLIPEDEIITMTILKDQAATDKYGVKAKHGAIEIKAKKTWPVISKDEEVKEIEVWSEKNIQNDDNIVFEKVEVEAAFPGGEKEWRNFLSRNLDANIPVKNGVKPGTYTVVIKFIVNKDGSTSDIKALTNHGFGMEEEAIRMIKKGPHWIPAIQNGHIVKAYRKQPLTFVIAAE